MNNYTIINAGEYEYILNDKNQVAVLVSKSKYLFQWSTKFPLQSINKLTYMF